MGVRPRPPRQPSWAAGFFVYFALPIFAFAVTALYLNTRVGVRRSTPAPPPAENTLQVLGSTCVLAGEHGARVELRLLPLHADPDRQRFDGVQLRRRFDLGPGEPWRLEIRYHADPGLPADEQPRLELAELHVENAEGVALRGLPAPTVQPSGLRDPLAELLSRAPDSVAPGQDAHLILWGPAPGEGSRVTGLMRLEDGASKPLFAPLNPRSELPLQVAALRQDREFALFQLDRPPEAIVEDQR
ncbi:MAG: hypothetical protein KDC14_07365 [Planctomycetes bacterium]|nr:hypothetical protein [Planctomycetota bacterium]